MDEKMYMISVSSLQVRKEPSEPSKINLSRGTIVKFLGKTKKYRTEEWILVSTVNEPVIQGYIPKRYVNKV